MAKSAKATSTGKLPISNATAGFNCLVINGQDQRGW
jgi:hypothetical protein